MPTMIAVKNILVSDDLHLVYFSCPLEKCKGACCVEGDAGAPLTEEEIANLEDHIESIKPFMTRRGIKEVERTGIFDYDAQGELVTPLVRGLECAFTNFSDGIAFCSIEKAFEEGSIKFRKPLSCHLYPIRISRLKEGEAENYHKWEICKKALREGNKLGVPLYKFCRDALIRKYGREWYEELTLLQQRFQ